MARGARGVEDVGEVVVGARHPQGRAVGVERLVPRHHRGLATGKVGPGTDGGVDHHGEIELHVPGRQFPIGHRPASLAVGQHPTDLGVVQSGAEGHGHRAGPVHRRIGHQPAQGVVQADVHGHPVVGGDARGHQAAGQLIGLAVPLGEGQ